MSSRIKLSPKKILNKQFQVGARGYNADEVDRFLDLVLSDYQNFAEMLNASYDDNDRLAKENQELKRQLQETRAQLSQVQSQQAAARYQQPAQPQPLNEANMTSNVDLLKRLSQLEKEVYSKKND
jgi:DivIVA domain-containing protein